MNKLSRWFSITKSLSLKKWFRVIVLSGILGSMTYLLSYEMVSRLYLLSSESEITLTIDWPKAHKGRPHVLPVLLTVDTSKVSLDKPLLRKTQNGWRPSYKAVYFNFFLDSETPDHWLLHIPGGDQDGRYISVEVGVSHKIFKKSYKQHYSRTSMPRREDLYGLEVFYNTPFKGDPSINVPPGDIGPLYMFYHPKTQKEKGVFFHCSGLKVHDKCSIHSDISSSVGFSIHIKPVNLKYWRILLSTVDQYLIQNFNDK